MSLSLYPWQQSCMEAWFHNKGRGIVQVVTGAGKTFMALSCAHQLDANYQGKLKIRILVPKTFMVSQWKSFILDQHELFGIERQDIGIWYGLHKDPPDRKVMLYVINSARLSLSRHKMADKAEGTPNKLIADECHHYASEENRRIFEFLPEVPSQALSRLHTLGLSATPQTEGFEQVLVPSLGPLIYAYGFSEAMHHRVINNCTLYNISLPMATEEQLQYEKYSIGIRRLISRLHLRTTGSDVRELGQFFIRIRKLTGDADPLVARRAKQLIMLLYKRKALVYEASARVECAFQIITRLDPNSRIIIFSERISQTEMLYELVEAQWPGHVGRYHSKMGEVARTRALQRYREKEVRILVCCRALDEGFDIPAADVGIVLSGTSTERQRTQRLGRILRRAEGKLVSSLFYLYLDGTVEDHALFAESIEDVLEFDLQYVGQPHGFAHPVYDQLASRIVSQEIDRGMDENKIAWLQQFLQLGQLRTDWLLDADVLAQRVKNSHSQVQRNYWMCMVRMARTR